MRLSGRELSSGNTGGCIRRDNHKTGSRCFAPLQDHTYHRRKGVIRRNKTKSDFTYPDRGLYGRFFPLIHALHQKMC